MHHICGISLFLKMVEISVSFYSNHFVRKRRLCPYFTFPYLHSYFFREPAVQSVMLLCRTLSVLVFQSKLSTRLLTLFHSITPSFHRLCLSAAFSMPLRIWPTVVRTCWRWPQEEIIPLRNSSAKNSKTIWSTDIGPKFTLVSTTFTMGISTILWSITLLCLLSSWEITVLLLFFKFYNFSYLQYFLYIFTTALLLL